METVAVVLHANEGETGKKAGPASVDVNPFTAPACKMSGLKDANSMFSGPNPFPPSTLFGGYSKARFKKL